jgi:HK97 family phage major capsid protein
MKLQDLYDKRAKLVKDMRAFLDTKENGLSAEDSEKYNKMESDLDSLSAKIKAEEKLQESEKFLNQPQMQNLGGMQTDKPIEDQDQKHMEAFLNFIKAGSINALSPDQARMLNALSEGTGASGGYLVPTKLQNKIIDELNNELWIRKLSNTYKTDSTTDIPVGGAAPAFAWMAEGDTFTQTDMQFSKITIGAKMLGAIMKVSNLLLQDSAIDLESYITKRYVIGAAEYEESGFLKGDGVKAPKGLITQITNATTTAAASITSDEVIDFVYGLKANYRRNAAIVASSDFVKSIRKLKDSNGQYIWQPAFNQEKQDTLLGKPLYESAVLDPIVTGNTTAIIADFTKVDVVDRGRMTMQKLIELYAEANQTGYLARKRTDIALTLANAGNKLVIG